MMLIEAVLIMSRFLHAKAKHPSYSFSSASTLCFSLLAWILQQVMRSRSHSGPENDVDVPTKGRVL